MQRLRLVGLLVLAGVSASLPESEVCACAWVPRAGETVHIAEESAFIVWDAANQTEHFIRRAQFDTKAKDFGFLVPTPNRPTLSEVDDTIFGYLLDLTRPPVREPARSTGRGAGAMIAAEKAASAKAAPVVRVLESVTVAGLDAAVIESNDAHALNAWLGRNAYVSSPELTEWFKPYVAGKWIITAFKISKGASSAGRAVTSAVRMSFRTDRPFFPYREPATRSAAPRVLEVYFLSGERVEGRIGGGSTTQENRNSGSFWPGRTLWAKPLDEGTRNALLDRAKLPANGIPTSVWLTRFLDTSAPRRGTEEVVFSRAKKQAGFLDADALHAELGRKAYATHAAYDAAGSRKFSAADEAAGRKLLEDGLVWEKRGDFREAIRKYRQAYLSGSGEAASRIGDIYVNGKGNVPRDYAESIVWRQRAGALDRPAPR